MEICDAEMKSSNTFNPILFADAFDIGLIRPNSTLPLAGTSSEGWVD